MSPTITSLCSQIGSRSPMRPEIGILRRFALALVGFSALGVYAGCSEDVGAREEASTEPVRHYLSVEFADGRRFHDGYFAISFREDQPDTARLSFGAIQLDTGRKVLWGGSIARPLDSSSFEVLVPGEALGLSEAYFRVECSEAPECTGPVERASSARGLFALGDLADTTGSITATPDSMSASIVGPWEANCAARASSFGLDGQDLRADPEWTTPFCAAALAEFGGMRPNVESVE